MNPRDWEQAQKNIAIAKEIHMQYLKGKTKGESLEIIGVILTNLISSLSGPKVQMEVVVGMMEAIILSAIADKAFSPSERAKFLKQSGVPIEILRKAGVPLDDLIPHKEEENSNG